MLSARCRASRLAASSPMTIDTYEMKMVIKHQRDGVGHPLTQAEAL